MIVPLCGHLPTPGPRQRRGEVFFAVFAHTVGKNCDFLAPAPLRGGPGWGEIDLLPGREIPAGETGPAVPRGCAAGLGQDIAGMRLTVSGEMPRRAATCGEVSPRQISAATSRSRRLSTPQNARLSSVTRRPSRASASRSFASSSAGAVR